MATRILLVRHGQTVGNREGKFYGHAETPLTAAGVEQARSVGRRLAREQIDVAYASDLSRALDTARYAVDGRDLDVLTDPRLREMHYGEWEELDGRVIFNGSRDTWQAFLRGDVPAPGGEDVTAVRWRTAAALREYAERHGDRAVLVVSHGNAIMAMVAELLGIPTASSWSFVVDNASITRVDIGRGGRATLVTFNERSHLEGVPGVTSA